MSLYGIIDRLEGSNLYIRGREKCLYIPSDKRWLINSAPTGARRRIVYDRNGNVSGIFELAPDETPKTDDELNQASRGRNGFKPAAQMAREPQAAAKADPPLQAQQAPAAATSEDPPAKNGKDILQDNLNTAREAAPPQDELILKNNIERGMGWIKNLTDLPPEALKALYKDHPDLMTGMARHLNGVDLNMRSHIQAQIPLHPTRDELLTLVSSGDTYWKAKLLHEIMNTERIGWQALLNTAANIVIHSTPPHSLTPEALQEKIVSMAKALGATITEQQNGGPKNA